MDSFIHRHLDFITLFFGSIFLYCLHVGINDKLFLLDSGLIFYIYIFNYSSVLFFLIFLKVNFMYKFVNSLGLFVVLTMMKMSAAVIFFLYFKSFENYNIQQMVYNFFPIYFLFLVFEVKSLKNFLNNN